MMAATYRLKQIIGRPGRISIALTVLVVVSAGAFARAQDADLNQWEAVRRQVRTTIERAKPLETNRVQDVMQLQVEGKWLVLRTPLPNTIADRGYQGLLNGIAGVALVSQVDRKVRGPATGLAEPANFSATFIRFPAPKQTASITISESSQPDEITIMKNLTINGGASRQVLLTQTRGLQSEALGLVRMNVTEIVTGGATQQLTFEAADFFTFLREHPEETAQYLRPMLREIGQESLFAPEPTVAWQVFSELWKPRDAIVRQVQALLPRLNASDYHARNAALAQLQQMGRDAAAVLLHLDRSALSPEQNARIDRALVPYAQLPSRESVRLRSDPGFLLDCLYSQDLTLRRVALDRLRAIVRPGLQFDVEADLSTRAAAVDVLRQQLVPSPRSGK